MSHDLETPRDHYSIFDLATVFIFSREMAASLAPEFIFCHVLSPLAPDFIMILQKTAFSHWSRAGLYSLVQPSTVQ